MAFTTVHQTTMAAATLDGQGEGEGGQRPSKKVKREVLERAEVEDEATRVAMLQLELDARGPPACTPAWSINNVLAWAPPSSASTSNAPTIAMTYLSGMPTSPHKSFALSLPQLSASASTEELTTLTFSPDGGYLLCSTSEGRLGVFEQAECIDDWTLVWWDRLSALGVSCGAVTRVLASRWIGEPREWYPTSAPPPSTPEDPNADILLSPLPADPVRPLKAGPCRSTPVVGCTVVLVLSSAEVLYLHIPRTPRPSPLVAIVSLASPSTAAVSPAPTSSASVDHLLASLAEGATPPIVPPGAVGAQAMKDELRAAAASGEADGGKERGKGKLAMAAIGVSPAPDLNTSHLLLVTLASAPLPSSQELLFSALTLSSTQSGVRLVLWPLPSICLISPLSEIPHPGPLRQLLFLEQENRMVLVGGFDRSLVNWRIEKRAEDLAEAFSGLECRKSDPVAGTSNWVAIRNAEISLSSPLAFLSPGADAWTFLAGHIELDREGDGNTSYIAVHDSETLQLLPGVGRTLLASLTFTSSVALSPSRTLVCVGPKASIAAVPFTSDSEQLPTKLGLRLAISLVKQVDSADVIGRIVGLRKPESVLDAMTVTRDTLAGMFKPGQLLVSSPLQLELLGVTATVFSTVPSLALRGELAHSIVELAACARAFLKSERTERSAPNAGFRCESDAVWPLIGHLTWYTELCRQLVLDCRLPGEHPHPRLLLLLHPLSRGYLLRIVQSILGLQSFLAAFSLHTNVTVDVTRGVLDDVVDFNGLVLTEWRSMLLHIDTLAGLSGDSPDLKEMLRSLTIPSSLTTSTTLLTALLASPALLLPSATPAMLTARDIVRRGELPHSGVFRVCLRCGERTEKKLPSENETGRWASWESAWESRCCCGGVWKREIVV